MSGSGALGFGGVSRVKGLWGFRSSALGLSDLGFRILRPGFSVHGGLDVGCRVLRRTSGLGTCGCAFRVWWLCPSLLCSLSGSLVLQFSVERGYAQGSG